MTYFIIYLIIVNIAGFIIMGTDKSYARRHKWRIPEAVLLTVSFIGGSLGSLLGMLLFHHKTKHIKFIILFPLFLLLHLAIAYFFFL